MTPEEQKALAKDSFQEVIQILRLHGVTPELLSKEQLSLYVDMFISGAKIALMALKKAEQKGLNERVDF